MPFSDPERRSGHETGNTVRHTADRVVYHVYQVYNGLALSRAHCPGIQQDTGIQHTTGIQEYSGLQYTVDYSIPLRWTYRIACVP